jgi:large subunit ribosomal protein L30
MAKKATAAAEETQAATLRITLVRSPIGYEKRQKETVKALGLRRMHQTIEKADTPEIRAMIGSVSHMVRIEE